MTLTVARATCLLTYEPATGVFRWLVPKGRARAGDEAGTTATASDGRQVRQIRVDGVIYLAHRLAWFMIYGAWPPQEIDHRNGDSCDNRLDNLRLATRAQNNQNIGVTKAVSGFRGVTFHAGKWRAQIKYAGHNHYLGRFNSPDEAHSAYVDKRKELFKFQPAVRAEKAVA